MPSLKFFFRGLFAPRADSSRGDRGAITAITSLALLPIFAVLAVGVDGGRVFVENQRVKTASEAAAMAAAGEWVISGAPCSASALEYVPENSGAESLADCSSTGTRYAGVVTVDVSKNVSALFGSLIGRESSTVDSSASVRVAPVGAVTGLRPTAICENSEALVSWRASGFSTSQVFTVDFNNTCAGVPGNWGVLDFDGGSNRTPDLQEWIDRGYPGRVSIGQEFNGDPGIPSPALQLNTVVGRTITVPVFDNVRLQGSTSIFRISSFATMDVVSERLNGSASSRYVEVRFRTNPLSGAQSNTGAPNNGVVTWSPCQLDGRGACS